ncbi:MAG: protein YgfX [Rhodanobacteraceae bacterium]
MKSASAIAFDHRPSRLIALAAGAIVYAAVAAPWFSGLPVGVRVALSLVAGAVGIFLVRRFLKSPIRRIAYRASGWVLVDCGDREHAALLRSHACLGPWVSLDFERDRARRFRAMLGPDNLDTETRRRLVVLLARAEVAHAG